MPSRINEKLGERIYRLVLASIFGVGYLAVRWLPFKTLCLFFSVAFLFYVAIDFMGVYFPSLKVGRVPHNLSGSIAMIIAAVYHLTHSSSILWNAFAWLCLTYGLLAFVTAGLRILMESVILADLKRSQTHGLSPKYHLPTLYVVGEPGRGSWAANRLAGKVGRALWQERYLRGGSSLVQSRDLRTRFMQKLTERAALGGRVAVYCIESAALGPQAHALRSFLINTTHAFVVVTTAPAWRKAPSSKDGANALWSTFWEETEEGWIHCSGPTFEIQINPLGASPFQSAERADTFLALKWPSPGRAFSDAVAPVLQRIANNCVPMARSDVSLDDATREVSRRLGRHALPPIAEAYLKVRLAQSDVERFNSLLDAIEALVRVAAIALLVEHWSQGSLTSEPKFNPKWVKPLTFGGWVQLLDRARTDSPSPSNMGKELRKFLGSDITLYQDQLMGAAAAAELVPLSMSISSQIQWVKWIVWLRNMTKGHGPLDENMAGKLWSELHAAFLAMAGGLDYLLFNSALVVLGADGAQLLGGWYRGGKRAFSEPLDSRTGNTGSPASGEQSPVYLRSPNREVFSLAPLLQCNGDDVFMWTGAWNMSNDNGAAEPYLELLSNATSKRTQTVLTNIQPFEDWRERKSASDFLAQQHLVREGPP